MPIPALAKPNTARAEEPPPVASIDRGVRQLFFDDEFVEQIDGLTRVVNAVTKHQSNPLVVADKPWEAGTLIIDNAVVYDEAARQFKMWGLVPSFAIGGQPRRTSYLVSADGIQWKRPHLGKVTYEGTGKNNILPVHVSNVVYDSTEARTGTRKRFFKGIAWDGKQYAAFSADGLQWTLEKDFLLKGAGDVFTPSRNRSIQAITSTDSKTAPGKTGVKDRTDRQTKRSPHIPPYLGFVRQMVRVGQFDRRVLAMTTSDDFVRWLYPTIILKPDAEDDELARKRLAAAKDVLAYSHPDDHRCEFYSMVGVPYEGIFIGLMFVFDVSFNRSRIGSSNQDGTRHVELVWSRDLKHWKRLPGRIPLIPLGKAGSWDAGMIGYAAAPILIDDEIRIYYSGQRLTHGAEWLDEIEKFKSGKAAPMSSVGLATLRRDGFVSLEARDKPGSLTTKPFAFPAGHLHLNVDAAQGSVRAALLNMEGNVLAESQAVEGDQLRAAVKFKGEMPPVGTPVKLRLVAQNAKLYAYWFK